MNQPRKPRARYSREDRIARLETRIGSQVRTLYGFAGGQKMKRSQLAELTLRLLALIYEPVQPQ